MTQVWLSWVTHSGLDWLIFIFFYYLQCQFIQKGHMQYDFPGWVLYYLSVSELPSTEWSTHQTMVILRIINVKNTCLPKLVKLQGFWTRVLLNPVCAVLQWQGLAQPFSLTCRLWRNLLSFSQETGRGCVTMSLYIIIYYCIYIYLYIYRDVNIDLPHWNSFNVFS